MIKNANKRLLFFFLLSFSLMVQPEEENLENSEANVGSRKPGCASFTSLDDWQDLPRLEMAWPDLPYSPTKEIIPWDNPPSCIYFWPHAGGYFMSLSSVLSRWLRFAAVVTLVQRERWLTACSSSSYIHCRISANHWTLAFAHFPSEICVYLLGGGNSKGTALWFISP